MVNIMRREAMDPMLMPLSRFDRLFSEFLGDLGDRGMMQDDGSFPIDVSEAGNTIIVRASLPGFKPEEIDIELQNGILTLSANHVEEKETKDERFIRRERRSGSAVRQVALPTLVDDERAEARFENGVLTLTIPKSQEALPRKVKVKK